MAPTDKSQNHGPALAAGLFDISENDLLIGGLSVRDIVAETGTPCFLYDNSAMRQAYRDLETALSGFADIYYSVKANPPARHHLTFPRRRRRRGNRLRWRISRRCKGRRRA
ncbi:Diaminopimelate decarboxylase DAP decarboxylase [Agrobacterium tumefaciens]|nr:Diaminopimelate decarboxylase DAP decarboxylase [Agrobacterium tumefaciens]